MLSSNLTPRLSTLYTSFRVPMSSSTHTNMPRRPRRFAPLDPNKPNNHSAPRLEGIVFDVDGTLCLPQNYMFREMRAALNIPKSTDILDHLHSLSTEPDSTTSPPTSPRQRANHAIKTIERNAMTFQTPQPGLVELITYIDKRKLPKALCTRNFPLPVNHLLEKFLPGVTFSPVITRETEGVRPKPSPEGLWRIAERWGLGLEQIADANGRHNENDPLVLAKEHLGAGLLMVGDSVDDMACAARANAASVLLLNEDNEHVIEKEPPDFVIRRLDELIDTLEQGFEGRN